ncbi:MAG: DUF2000 domain-containing protein [Desulfobacter sp.]|nr:DUF2000 domain-containing protein [Desulfobacter sp.]WDP83801.1 MAG: DUF2000 domain-containing protein [Desulfobacter sp.]
MKIVILVNPSLGPGLAANTAAVLGISLGHRHPAIIGPDLLDHSGTLHPGITQKNIPILGLDSQGLKTIYDKARKIKGIEILGFNTIAQKSRHYEEYGKKLAALATRDIDFSGICLKGPKLSIEKLTGALPLLK